MPYEFKYRLNWAPNARQDGSAQAVHAVDAIFHIEGSPDPFVVVPGHHKNIPVPADELLEVMAMPNTPAKITAYKQLLVDHRDDLLAPAPSDWTAAGMQAFMQANTQAADAATQANDYITVTLQLTYPVEFTI